MSAAYLMAVPHGAAEAAQVLGSDGRAPGLNSLPACHRSSHPRPSPEGPSPLLSSFPNL